MSEQIDALPHIVGIVRFSVVTRMLGDRWRATKGKPPEAAARYLFRPARLEPRFGMFERITLASLDAQELAAARFTLIVLTSSLMPEPWLARLRALLDARPYARLLVLPPDVEPETALTEALREIAAGQDVITTFRIDDDDALATDAIARMAAHATPANSGRIVTFENGYGLASTSHEGAFILKDTHYPFIALGLGYVSPVDDLRTIFALGSHDKLHDLPAIIDPAPGMWMRALHTGSDSQITPRPWYLRHYTDEEQRIPADQVRERLGPRFAFLDLDAVHPLLAASKRPAPARKPKKKRKPAKKPAARAPETA